MLVLCIAECHRRRSGGLYYCEIIKKFTFIALIHPIQWTIAFPVGADRPAKRQKKSFGMHAYWPAGPGVHSPGVASSTSFLASARDVIASFFVWRESCASEYFQCLKFVNFSGYLRSFLILLIAK